jgi:PST family polysaccharide transporter
MLWVIAAAIFPAYATIQNQSTILRQGFLATVRYIAMFTVPLCIGLAVAAGPVVRVAFGEQWLDAIPIVRILALFALVSSIGFNVGDVYKATGRPDILVKLSLVHLAIGFPVLWFGAQYSLIGVATGQLATAIVMMVLRLWVATWVIKVTIGDMLHQLKPSLLSGMVLIVVLLPCLFLTEGILPLFRLFILALVGAVTYTSTLWLLDRESLLQGSQVIGLSGFLRKRKFALSTSTDVEPSVRDL